MPGLPHRKERNLVTTHSLINWHFNCHPLEIWGREEYGFGVRWLRTTDQNIRSVSVCLCQFTKEYSKQGLIELFKFHKLEKN